MINLTRVYRVLVFNKRIFIVASGNLACTSKHQKRCFLIDIRVYEWVISQSSIHFSKLQLKVLVFLENG